MITVCQRRLVRFYIVGIYENSIRLLGHTVLQSNSDTKLMTKTEKFSVENGGNFLDSMLVLYSLPGLWRNQVKFLSD